MHLPGLACRRRNEERVVTLRRLVALTAVLSLVAAFIAPLTASEQERCAMCARKCCCAPRDTGDRCRISRPCGSATSPGNEMSTQGPGKPALLPRPAASPESLATRRFQSDAGPMPADDHADPPDHPPRAFL
jgi:hypothetical protein